MTDFPFSTPQISVAASVRQRQPHQIHHRLTAESPRVQLRSSYCVTVSGRTVLAERMTGTGCQLCLQRCWRRMVTGHHQHTGCNDVSCV
jgi:hypothetical protein